MNIDPLPYMKNLDYAPIKYFLERDVLNEVQSDASFLWNQSLAKSILAQQQPNGSWPDPNRIQHLTSSANYIFIESIRQLLPLAHLYEFTRTHPQIEKAGRFLLSCQTEQRDIRGAYGNQYCPDYMGVILEILINFGYEDNPGVIRAMEWLIYNQMDDGGWVVPMHIEAVKKPDLEGLMRQATFPMPSPSTPSAHGVTGMVLGALYSHPRYRNSPQAKKAAKFLTSRLLQDDLYGFRVSKDNWTSFQYPFFWTDLISALDLISKLNIPVEDPIIQTSLDYFRDCQLKDGSWHFEIPNPFEIPYFDGWITMKIARIFKNFYGK